MISVSYDTLLLDMQHLSLNQASSQSCKRICRIDINLILQIKERIPEKFTSGFLSKRCQYQIVEMY